METGGDGGWVGHARGDGRRSGTYAVTGGLARHRGAAAAAAAAAAAVVVVRAPPRQGGARAPPFVPGAPPPSRAYRLPPGLMRTGCRPPPRAYVRHAAETRAHTRHAVAPHTRARHTVAPCETIT
ncbi:hypothetical protein GCM10018785_61130 [Streptomyces longispororuber]|uniref:Uncharacterized protein n=1 Tax=Streptomyces longispororuber TaxID=68230 RepID=A0A919A421_9ACTN|nr:hypothetical protein GCM10018785_61130 [Streptomyces longispororuber]